MDPRRALATDLPTCGICGEASNWQGFLVAQKREGGAGDW